MLDLTEALTYVVTHEGSDLHLKVGARPLARIHGRLAQIEAFEALGPEDTISVLREMLDGSDEKFAEFEQEGEVDFAFAVPGLSRFRVNAFRQRGSTSIVARVIPWTVKRVDELGLPAVIEELADEERGLILLTGTTGSGKSTTLAAIIDHINSSKARHIVTIEDPIEYLHRDNQSIVNQREVGMDTGSFPNAMRRVLRQDPDVILIGEMRDEVTVRTALSAAETGHLVLSTVHTLDAPETVNRIIDFFPPHEQTQARAMLAGTLRGIVSQRLVRTIDGNGRVAACEVLRMTGRARDMILDSDQTGHLHEVIKEGSYYGMQTFDQALLAHYQAGRISMEAALRVASNPHDFKLLVVAKGRTSTSMDDLDGSGRPALPDDTGSPARMDDAASAADRPAAVAREPTAPRPGSAVAGSSPPPQVGAAQSTPPPPPAS